MGSLLPPWQLARFDQIDAHVRDLVLRHSRATTFETYPGLPVDPFLTDPR